MTQSHLPWYVLHVRARHEPTVASFLRGKGYEIFLPQYRERREWSDRVKDVEVPLFPGYLFCQLDLTKRLGVMKTPGVIQIVGAGKTFVPVEPSEIESIQAIVAAQVRAQPWPYLQVGQRVRLEGGPLKGLEGILLAMKPQRLVVSVTLLQRSVAADIDPAWARPIEGPTRLPGSSLALATDR